MSDEFDLPDEVVTHIEDADNPTPWRVCGEFFGQLSEKDIPAIETAIAAIHGTDGEEADDSQEPESDPEHPFPPHGEYRVGNFWVVGGEYGDVVQRTVNGETRDEFDLWTSFQLDKTATLRENGTVYFDLTVIPALDEEPFDVQVEPKVFNEPRDFKNSICTGATTTFSGGYDELNTLRRFVGGQDAPTKHGTTKLGIHTGENGAELVLPDGALRGNGWTDDAEHVFTGESSGLSESITLAPDRDDYDRDEVAAILDHLAQSRDPERGLPLLGWMYAAPFKPFVMDQRPEFPIMNVMGETGAGKTSTAQVYAECFGLSNNLLSADNTPFPIMRAMETTNSIPVMLDEFKPSDISNYRVDKLFNYLRAATRNGSVQKGRADRTVETHTLTAPVCVLGEQAIRGPAEERRTLLTTLRDTTTTPETDTEAHYDALTGYDLSNHALAYWRWVLAQSDPDDVLQERWKQAGEHVEAVIDELGITITDEVTQHAYHVVAFGVRCFRDFATRMGADIDALPVSDDHVHESIAYLAGEYGGTDRASHLDTLLKHVGHAVEEDYLEHGKHYTFVTPQKGEYTDRPLLCLRFELVFNGVTKYIRDYNVQGEDILDADDYLGRIADAEDDDENYVAHRSYVTNSIGRVVAFDFERLLTDVDGLDRTAFGDDPPPAPEAERTYGELLEEITAILDRDGTDGALPRGELYCNAAEALDCQPDKIKATVEWAVEKGRLLDNGSEVIRP